LETISWDRRYDQYENGGRLVYRYRCGAVSFFHGCGNAFYIRLMSGLRLKHPIHNCIYNEVIISAISWCGETSGSDDV
jgi:hypothetical protein